MDFVRLIWAMGMFALLTWLASFPITHGWDRAVTVWLQRAAPAPDIPSLILVFLGDAEIVIPGVALAALLFLRRDSRRMTGGLWLAAGLAGAGLLAVVLKHLIVHPGPPPELWRPVPSLGVNLPTPYSFPSGHTLRTTILAGTALRRRPVLAALLVLCMMAALVYLGDHWLSDVLGGLCLGWACIEVTAAALAGRLGLRT